MEIKNLKEEVVNWSVRFPVDKWWRERHKIPFMSKLHRECSFIDQLFEYEEERLFKDLLYRKKLVYVPNIGEFLNIDEMDIDSMSKLAMDEINKLNGG